MRLFECQACGQPLYFENVRCDSCGRALGYLPSKNAISALEQDGDHWKALADPDTAYKYCANYQYESCNWLLPADRKDPFCRACRHNRTIPDLTDPRNLMLWRRVEAAKHRLFYSLVRLNLPLITKVQDPEDGLAFDFLAPQAGPVMTGHLSGFITINLAEADDSEREKQRGAMGEPYRTLLGHFRHEVAHYYWERIIRSQDPEGFRAVFGDERADYGEALQRHHTEGPPSNWAANYVSAYATSHPWEDFAETWAHYFHIVDTLETARAFGIRTKPRVASSPALESSVDFDPYSTSFDQLIGAWLPLTFAFNSINRSMGLNDLYPFVLGPSAVVKLTYVSDQIHQFANLLEPDDSVTLKALVAGLRNKGMSASKGMSDSGGMPDSKGMPRGR